MVPPTVFFFKSVLAVPIPLLSEQSCLYPQKKKNLTGIHMCNFGDILFNRTYSKYYHFTHKIKKTINDFFHTKSYISVCILYLQLIFIRLCHISRAQEPVPVQGLRKFFLSKRDIFPLGTYPHDDIENIKGKNHERLKANK